MSKESSSLLMREPGFFERYYICRSTGDHYNKGFNMSVCLNKRVDDVLLSNALRSMLLKYPTLCMNLFRLKPSSGPKNLLHDDRKANGTNYEARLVSKIQFTDVVCHQQLERIDDDYFKTLSDRKILIDTDKPTWYILVNEVAESSNQYLTFATNHMFLDGNSGVNFLDDLVRELATAKSQSNLKFVNVLFDSEVEGPKILPESSDKVTDLFSFSTWFAIKTIVKELFLPTVIKKLFSSFFTRGDPNLFKNPIFNHHPVSLSNESNFHLLTLSPEETSASLKFCKSEGVTLTPFIAGCAFKALDETLVPVLNIKPSYEFAIPICGRRYYPEIKEKTRYGLYMSQSKILVSRNNSVLSATKFISHELVAALKSRESFSLAGLLRLINIWDHIQNSYDKKEVRSSAELSNVGLIKINHGEWRVEDCIFSQGVSSTHFSISTCSTPYGGLNIMIANHYSLDEIRHGLAMKRFMVAFKEKLVARK
ncbi:alcohol O-acetyltransferase [Saccharomycopsis crataegensis]|uniref:Alcohol O-acetyltransferase n=1 Tax=Saccharomycopsis crataegensis TaxID=43959 RepID=A0AAV5QM36_9ASCO|nr:alcohol O-acetyltransferase [Saccharomycopsis crataegensis]